MVIFYIFYSQAIGDTDPQFRFYISFEEYLIDNNDNVSGEVLGRSHPTYVIRVKEKKNVGSLKINSRKAIVTFERGEPNITATSAIMTMARKFGFFILRLADYSSLPTCIHHTIVVGKYVLVSIIRYFLYIVIGADGRIFPLSEPLSLKIYIINTSTFYPTNVEMVYLV